MHLPLYISKTRTVPSAQPTTRFGSAWLQTNTHFSISTEAIFHRQVLRLSLSLLVILRFKCRRRRNLKATSNKVLLSSEPREINQRLTTLNRFQRAHPCFEAGADFHLDSKSTFLSLLLLSPSRTTGTSWGLILDFLKHKTLILGMQCLQETRVLIPVIF